MSDLIKLRLMLNDGNDFEADVDQATVDEVLQKVQAEPDGMLAFPADGVDAKPGFGRPVRMAYFPVRAVTQVHTMTPR